MKLTVLITPDHEEEVVIYAHQKTPLTEAIQRLITDAQMPLIGYHKSEAVPLTVSDVHCFIVEDDRVFALTDTEKLRLKQRLYQLADNLPESFVKINQSCIANIQKIQRFDVSISGTLLVMFKNGYREYVSRRNIKHVKGRLGL